MYWNMVWCKDGEFSWSMSWSVMKKGNPTKSIAAGTWVSRAFAPPSGSFAGTSSLETDRCPRWTRLYFTACGFWRRGRILRRELRFCLPNSGSSPFCCPNSRKEAPGPYMVRWCTMSSMPALHAISVANWQFQTFTGHRCLIFSQSVRMLDLIQAMTGWPSCFVNSFYCKCRVYIHIILHRLPSCVEKLLTGQGCVLRVLGLKFLRIDGSIDAKACCWS